MRIYDNGIYRDLTPEELATIQAEAERQEREYWLSISYKQAVVNEIRKKYDESDEFAILRQKEEKPEEYKEYFRYCESCKAFVKEKLGVKEG